MFLTLEQVMFLYISSGVIELKRCIVQST